MAKPKNLINFIILSMTLLFSMPAFTTEVDGSIANCLKAWGKHPFGNNPGYKTLGTSVKVFGIGEDPTDSEVTNSPSLVLVNPGVNVMGGSTIELLNPKGWYCLRTNVNVMGGLTIKVNCKAHLASATGAVTVLGSNSGQKSITVMGSTKIEQVGCN
ncbi:MAG: hypothetical protein PHO08_17775 [Methylococcales bacterium]|nr:hypothetical protein [Methylococcales bacterium]